MELSVVIVNYNVRVFLENALVSVCKAMQGMQGEVIVVDNASDDGSVEMLRQKFPSVHLIVNRQNTGFAAANNTAMRQAKGKYILLLNPDTIVQEDTFRTMIDVMNTHPDVGLAGCKILNPDGSLQLACRRSFPTPWVAMTKIFGLSSLFPHSPLFSKYNLEYLDPNQSYEVDALSGSFMLLRREILESVGGLDEQFFMYGEDLDWCYRVKQAGWKVMYVHSTQIIHYKGQSARRSEIDEVKLFYQAMRVFVQKHFKSGALLVMLLQFGIALRQWMAFIGRRSRVMAAALVDLLLIDCSLLLGEFIWFGNIFHFPHFAYPLIMTVPWLAVALTMLSMGIYSKRKLSLSHTASAVIIGYVFLSALTFFFKGYAFSRMVVAISGVINVIVLPGWRLAVRSMMKSPQRHRRTLFGRRTVIVGVDGSGQAVLHKLRARVDDGYDVVGFVDINRKRIGEKVAGVEILGSIDNIGKVIEEQKATEVIFSTDVLSYANILSVIGQTGNKAVNFRLVPSSLEVIIGKTHIDELDDIPLVDIDYNIDRPSNRIIKRLVDLCVSSILMITVYPFTAMRRSSQNPATISNGLPRVLNGEWSLVGPMPSEKSSSSGKYFIGKPGLTGLVQINLRDDLTSEEVEKYNLYYAKHQSLLLDIEILMKSMFKKS